MLRFPSPALVISAVSALAASGCATIPPAGPTPFYASWSGADPRTQPVFELVDASLRADPALVRDFKDAMNVHIADGAPVADGRFRYRVRITIPARLAGRRISERRRILADFSVTCAPETPRPCLDEIVARVRPQPAAIRRIVARSPKA